MDSRRIKRAEPIDDRLLEAIPDGELTDPFAAALNAAFIAALEEALAELPVRQRAAWVMREIELMTFPRLGRLYSSVPTLCGASITVRPQRFAFDYGGGNDRSGR